VTEVSVLQNRYAVVLKLAEDDYVLRDTHYDTPYRFRLWYDPAHEIGGARPELAVEGAWLMRNMDFESGSGSRAAAE
jgi:hypothetical protein